jgi:hypothetical protein
VVECVIVGGSLSTAYFDYLVLQALDLHTYLGTYVVMQFYPLFLIAC